MATETMLSKVPIKPEQVFRIKGEYKDTEKAAQEYEQVLRTSFKIADGQFPRFDLVFLGIGNEGPTASLFPGTKALHETKRLAARNWVGKLYTNRITLTAPAINNAARVIFMVTGRGQGAGIKRHFGRTARARPIAGTTDSAAERQTSLVGGHGRRRHAFYRNSR